MQNPFGVNNVLKFLAGPQLYVAYVIASYYLCLELQSI